MSYIKMNETQMISALMKCLDFAEERSLELTFEDSIEFLNEAMGIDFHSNDLDIFIEKFVSNKES